MIQRECGIAIYPATFDAILKKLANYVNLDKLTAKDIARIIEFGYAQKLYGENEMFNELRGV